MTLADAVIRDARESFWREAAIRTTAALTHSHREDAAAVAAEVADALLAEFEDRFYPGCKQALERAALREQESEGER